MAPDLLGSFGLGGVSVSNIVDKIYLFVGILFLAAIIGAVIGLGYMMWVKKKAMTRQKKIGWWEEINGKPQPTDMEDVEEIVIPGTTLKVFYGKKRDIWLPRFTKGITKDLYYVLITPTKQMVNFTLGSLQGDLKTAGLEHDYTDMLWAAENTREFIKRNYKDKSIKWWQLYKDTISTAIHIMIHTFSMILIIYFLRGLVEDISAVAGSLQSAVESSCTSGIAAGLLMIKLRSDKIKNGF